MRLFAFAALCFAATILSDCGGGSTAPAAPAAATPNANGTVVAALAVAYSGALLLIETFDFEAEVIPITSAGSVVTDGTVLAYPIAVAIGGGCGTSYTMTTQTTAVPLQGWIGATPPSGCTSSAFSVGASTSAAAGTIAAGPVSLAGPLAVSIAGLARVSRVPTIVIPVATLSAIATSTVISSTCPSGTLSGGAMLVLTPPLQSFACSAVLSIISGGSTQNYALNITST